MTSYVLNGELKFNDLNISSGACFHDYINSIMFPLVLRWTHLAGLWISLYVVDKFFLDSYGDITLY